MLLVGGSITASRHPGTTTPLHMVSLFMLVHVTRLSYLISSLQTCEQLIIGEHMVRPGYTLSSASI